MTGDALQARSQLARCPAQHPSGLPMYGSFPPHRVGHTSAGTSTGQALRDGTAVLGRLISALAERMPTESTLVRTAAQMISLT